MSNPNVIELQCRCLQHLFTKIRDQDSSRADFVKYSRRLMRVICEEGIACLDPTPLTITTPTQSQYNGSVVDTNNIVAVSIIRAGDSMLVRKRTLMLSYPILPHDFIRIHLWRYALKLLWAKF